MSTDSYTPSKEPDSKRFKPNEPQFSRRHDSSARSTPSSSFVNHEKKTPSWLRSNRSEINGKYDKYGERPLSHSSASSTDDRVNRLKRARELQRPPDRYRHQESGDQNEEEETDEGISPYINLQVANPSAYNNEGEPRYQTFQSRISNREYRDTNSIVRAHYNQRTQQAKQQGSRVNSPIYKLRNFNNAIKYILLGNWVKNHPEESDLFSLLDLCCGKGGDLNKCEFVGIDQYIGIDIADLSVREAYERYSKQKARFKQASRNSNRYNFEACFATGDCFTQFVPDVLEPNFPGIINRAFPVDAVSAQFSLHYSFESEEKVRTLLTNVTRSLCPGGTFIGTIPSSDFIKSQIVEKKYTRDDKGKLKFGNSLYSVTFEKDPPEDGVFSPAFGNKYNYWLKDAVDNVPEYVVPFETLRALCEEYDLVLKYKKNFIDIFNLEIPKYFNKLNKNLIEGMKRSDGKYGAEGDEKEAVGFYIGFVFEKV